MVEAIAVRSLYPRGPVTDDGKFILWIDVFIISLLAITTLLLLPSTLSRLFGGKSKWKRGFVLYSSSRKPTARKYAASAQSTLIESSASDPKRTPPLFNIVRSSALIHVFKHAPRLPLIPGISYGKAAIFLSYFGILLFAALYKDSVFTNPVRAAYVGLSQLPFVYLFATKNGFLNILWGKGYDKLNYLHRITGRLVVLAVNVHALGFIYKWTQQGVFTERTQLTFVRWGIVALVSADILFVFSLHSIRQNYYKLFYFSHLVGMAVILVGVSFHQEATRPYTITAAALYIADRLIRLFKSRLCTARITCLPELRTTLVRVTSPKLNAGWRPGQHVRIMVFSRGMGFFGWAETHPFSIASAGVYPYAAECQDSLVNGELVLLVKRTGDWTKKLYALAEEREVDAWPDKGTDVKVLVQGPYGGPGNTDFTSYSGVLLIIGGSGISYALSVAQSLIRDTEDQENPPVKTIELVWIVQHARSITPLLPALTALLKTNESVLTSQPSRLSGSSTSSCSRYNRPTLKISVHYTRALTHRDAETIHLVKDDELAIGPKLQAVPKSDRRTTEITIIKPPLSLTKAGSPQVLQFTVTVPIYHPRSTSSLREPQLPSLPFLLTTRNPLVRRLDRTLKESL